MARKGKEIQLQREIETQEEWEDMLSKEGLCVVDIYQGWCGLCSGMISNFKKYRNDINDDLLLLFAAKADTIDALEKYRGRCEPCFLFYAGGVMVAVVRGANAPLILRTITEQLAQEHKVLDGQAERKEIKDTVIAQLEERDKQKEEEEEEVEEPVKEVSVVIIKPDAVQSGKADEIMEEMKHRGIEILRQEERVLTEDEVKNVYTHLQDESFFDELVAFMTSSPSIVLAITKGKTGENVIKEFRDLIGPPEVEDAKEAAPESLRAKYGQGKFMNAVHGSDSQDTAARELAFFFPDFVAPKQEGKQKLQRTLALIRPDAYKNNKEGILAKIRESGFKVAMSKEITFTKEQAEDFYKEHKGQDYFEELTDRMSSGPLLALGLAREEAVSGWREMLGPTKVDDAKEQAPHSLRAQFSEEGAKVNMLHGSDSEETAKKEIEYFFPMEQTVAVIKPDAYGTKDEIIEKIHEAGFRIAARKETTLSKDVAEEFYADHKDKDYYNDLVEHMTSGPTCFMVLSREGAVDGWRSLIGPTDPTKAKEAGADTTDLPLRALYGQDPLRNAVHGSSNPQHAMSQITKIFDEKEAQIIVKQWPPDRAQKSFTIYKVIPNETEHPTQSISVPALQVTEVPSVDPDQLEEAIAEQQEVSYEPAPEYERQVQQEEKPAEDQTPQQPGEQQQEEKEEQKEAEAVPEQQSEQQAETTQEKAKSPEPQAQEEQPAQQTTEEQTEQKPSEESKPEETQPAEEPVQTEQQAEATEEPAKQEEEPAKTEEEPAKTEEEPAKTEEEPAKTEEPAQAEEQKTEEPTEQKTEETQEKKEETPADGGGEQQQVA